MKTASTLHTERLLLAPLSLNDDAFILELLNTADWIKYIGQRNIHSLDDARAYIQKIVNNTSILYWVIKNGEEENPIGMVTFIKREYLPNHDLGFALLPQFYQRGYAFEASSAVLKHVTEHYNLKNISAITIPENERSICLIEKLGLRFEKEIIVENEKLLIYTAASDT